MKKEYSLLKIRTIAVLSRIDNGIKENHIILMHKITEEDEHNIDRSLKENVSKMPIFYKDNHIICQGREILAYGDININNKDDYETIKELNICNPSLFPSSNWMPSNFDYNKGTCTTEDDGILKWFSTWDNIKWFKYNHCLIGKPKKVIIYKIKPRDYHDICSIISKSYN